MVISPKISVDMSSKERHGDGAQKVSSTAFETFPGILLVYVAEMFTIRAFIPGEIGQR